MEDHGVAFQPSLSGTAVAEPNQRLLPRRGQGAGVNAYYNTAEDLGVTVAYESEVTQVHVDGDRFRGASRRRSAARRHGLRGLRPCPRLGRVPGRSGLARAGLGAVGAELPDPGHALQSRRAAETDAGQGGADSVGDPTQCHAVAIDGRLPRSSTAGIVTRLDCVPFSVVVNQNGRPLLRRGRGMSGPSATRSGAASWRHKPDQVAYAVIGRQIAGAVHCRRSTRRSRPTRSKGLRRSWACRATSCARRWTPSTPRAREGEFHPTELDGLSTEGLTPPQDQLGAADHRAALLRLLAAAPA